MASNAPECIECGADPIYHRLTYVTVAIDEAVRPLVSPGPLMRFLAKGVYAVERRFTPAFFRFAIKMGWATRVDAPDEETMLLAKMLWEEAGNRNIEVFECRLFGLARNVFIARFPNGKYIAFEGIPLPPHGAEQAHWMDNKAEMKKQFRKLGFPVAAGGAALTHNGAKRLYKKVQPPVIIKPYSGSASRHTTLHIDNEQELERAFYVSKQVAPFAIVEEELIGPVYRATVVDGKLSAALRRDPPHVIGDGLHNIRQLVDRANEHPARGGPYFSKLKIDSLALRELAWQGLRPIDIPEAGQRVTFHQKINWSLGGTTADVTDEVHADNRELFENVGKALKAPVVGIDFIIADMSRSWKEQERCGIIECNSMPFFDNHHLPFEGEPRNVAGDIWAMVEP